MRETLTFCVPCLFGVESLAAQELRDMELENVRAENGRVLFSGGWEAMARANLNCRFGERVLLLLGEFPRPLLRGAVPGGESHPMGRVFRPGGRLSCNGQQPFQPAAQRAGLSVHHQEGGGGAPEGEIQSQLVPRNGTPAPNSFPHPEGPSQSYGGYQRGGPAQAGLPGQVQHRPYQRDPGGQPVQAQPPPVRRLSDRSLLRLRHHFGGGALLAWNIAPGLGRAFTAQTWGNVPASLWERERERARSLERRDSGFRAQGFDIDPASVELTLENARKAGVEQAVSASVRDIRDFSQEDPYGCMVCNPPYGERLLDVRQAEELYQVLGRVFQPRRGWSLGVITPDGDFETLFGRRADKRRKLYNGMIQCQYYQYFKGEGRGRESAAKAAG